MDCKICSSKFNSGTDIIYLCDHKQGFVHSGCCVNNCSWDKSPCKNKISSFMNIDHPKK
ncbi:hypothetical protein GF327_09560 [Candidatus Woesearchaeota archaeon]|nr:hypothetical protein [Candidatus Woesearchaeota archaeon]